MTLRTFSSGGGWQSIAALVLSAEGRIDFPVHLFSNVGDDSEMPATLTYVRNVAMPYAEAHGIEFVELRRPGMTLLERALQPKGTEVYLPIRGSETGKPWGRECTDKFKVQVINRWIKAHGACAADPAIVGIGISVDEIERASGRNGVSYRRVEYPLIQLGLRRSDCPGIISAAGLPMPPAPACFFCPMHRPSAWADMRRDEPVLFRRSVEIEATINEHRAAQGKEPAYLTRFGKPLDQAIGERQAGLFPDQDGWGETCDEGTCFI